VIETAYRRTGGILWPHSFAAALVLWLVSSVTYSTDLRQQLVAVGCLQTAYQEAHRGLAS